MATKSILKNITIKDKRSAEKFANALEKARVFKKKENFAPRVTIASVDEIRKMFDIQC